MQNEKQNGRKQLTLPAKQTQTIQFKENNHYPSKQKNTTKHTHIRKLSP